MSEYIVKCQRGLLSQLTLEDGKDNIVINSKEPMVFGGRNAAMKTMKFLIEKTGQRFWVETINKGKR